MTKAPLRRIPRRSVPDDSAGLSVSLSRPAARTLLRFATGALLCCMGIATLCGALLICRLMIHPIVIQVFSLGILLTLGSAIVACVLGRLVAVREASAGYTSLPHRFRELPQVEPYTGRVIREAGEPYQGRYANVR
jgi:hypothetical protein